MAFTALVIQAQREEAAPTPHFPEKHTCDGLLLPKLLRLRAVWSARRTDLASLDAKLREHDWPVRHLCQ